MTPLQARICIVFSALLHAGWNGMLRRQAKNQPQGQPGLVVLAVGLVAALVVLVAAPAQPRLEAAQAGWAALAGLGEACYFVTLGPALASLPLGQAYGYVRGGGMLLVWGTSTAFLGEPLSLLGTGGCGLLLVGLLWPTAGAGFRFVLPPPSVLACAAGVSVYHLAYGQGLHAGAGAPALLCCSMAVALPAMLLVSGRQAVATARQTLVAAPWPLVAAGVVSTAAFLLFLLSLRHLEAGSGFALRNSSIVFAQLMGWCQGEAVTKTTVARTAVLFAGACCVAAA